MYDYLMSLIMWNQSGKKEIPTESDLEKRFLKDTDVAEESLKDLVENAKARVELLETMTSTMQEVSNILGSKGKLNEGLNKVIYDDQGKGKDHKY